MITESRLQRVIVVPRSGYANRLQAWASAAIIASGVGRPLSVVWEPEPVSPAEIGDLFETSAAQEFLAPTTFEALAHGPHGALPRYLTIDRDRDLIILAGHDLGEQRFMRELGQTLSDPACPSTLIIIAGGKFHLEANKDFAERRRTFYTKLPWKNEILERLENEFRARGNYVGLHIRQTDRSREAPTKLQIRKALRQLEHRQLSRSLFITADSREARDSWVREASELGFVPWVAEHQVLARTDRRSGADAILDWLLLSRAESSIYSRTSTFGEEAAVAGGYSAVLLTANPLVRGLRDVRSMATSLRQSVTR